MANRYTKRCSISLAVREMQIKTTMRFYLTPVGVTYYQKIGNSKSWKCCGEKGTLIHCCWECKLVQPLWKTVWRFLKKFRIELPHDPATLLPGIYLKNLKIFVHNDICTLMFIAALFMVAKTWRQPKCPLIERTG